MPKLVFTQAGHAPLTIQTGADQISFSYGLNTANYSTYGGEVVQILSAYVDDLTVKGTVPSYKKLEEIYSFFINYIQQATQAGGFEYQRVFMSYPERDWNFQIIPRALPGFRYGREVVAPTWEMTAAVYDPGLNFESDLISDATRQFLVTQDIELFGSVTLAEFSNPERDPFTNPDANQQYKKDQPRTTYGNLADWYNNLIPSYLSGNFVDLTADYSRPTFLAGGTTDGANTGTQQAKQKADQKKR